MSEKTTTAGAAPSKPVDDASGNGTSNTPAPPQARKRPPWGLLVFVVILALIIGFWGIPYYEHARMYESTDDAFIDGHVSQVSPQVAGHVEKVLVSDNQWVKKGDVLVELDPRDYQIALAKAQAELKDAQSASHGAYASMALSGTTTEAGVQQAGGAVSEAESGVTTAKTGVTAAEAAVQTARSQVDQAQAAIAVARNNASSVAAQVRAAQADAVRTHADAVRYSNLYRQDAASRQQLDNALAADRSAAANLTAAQDRARGAQNQVNQAQQALDTANAQLAQAQAQVPAARSQVSAAEARVQEAQARMAAANVVRPQHQVSQAQFLTANANVQQKEAAVKQAQLNLSYCTVRAAVDGKVTHKTVQVGNYVTSGQALMALVEPNVWVTGNFKETQLREMRAGDPVEIHVDAYPGVVFHGKVDSIQSGSGAAFSLLPPENATGNYVKVVQRVPVKIDITDKIDPNQYVLGPGMSVVPDVKVH
ncbi:MAG: HlyD family secretion protein [Candidatus Xenobia bacterium]